MKTNKLLYLVLMLLVGITACDKEKDDNTPDTPTTYEPHGLWIGTYTITQLPSMGSKYYSFVIKPDGKVLTEGVGADGNTYYSKGTWALVGDSVKATIVSINQPVGPPVTQYTSFYFNKNTRTSTGGTIRDGANGSNYTGTFPTMVIVD